MYIIHISTDINRQLRAHSSSGVEKKFRFRKIINGTDFLIKTSTGDSVRESNKNSIFTGIITQNDSTCRNIGSNREISILFLSEKI